jgi:hypothetical protein
MKNKTINEYIQRGINKANKFTSVTSKLVKCFKYSYSQRLSNNSSLFEAG